MYPDPNMGPLWGIHCFFSAVYVHQFPSKLGPVPMSNRDRPMHPDAVALTSRPSSPLPAGVMPKVAPKTLGITHPQIYSFHDPQPGEITISPRDGQRSAKSAWLDRTKKASPVSSQPK